MSAIGTFRNPYYGNFAGLPSRFTPSEGWVYYGEDGWKRVDGSEGFKGWTRLPRGDVNNDSRILTKEEFEERFPNTPALPPEAFQKAGPLDD